MSDEYRVLVVDDSKAMRIMLKGIMENNSITSSIYEATSGIEAFAAFPEVCPDLIIMDLFMPDGNGLDAIRKIHAIDPTIAILVITSSDDIHDTQDAIRFGAIEVIRKPFVPNEVAMKIQKILRDKDRRIADLYNKTVKLLMRVTTDETKQYVPSGSDKTHIQYLKKKVEGKA